MHEPRPAPSDELAGLVATHQPALMRLVRHDGADDAAVHQAVVDAWRAAMPARATDGDAFRTALFTEAIRRTRELERSRPERAPAAEIDPFEPDASRWANWFITDPPSFAQLVTDRVTTIRARATADAALSSLPFQERVVVVLRDVAGWAPDETTQLLGIDPMRARVLLHAGRKRVRLALEGLIGDLSASGG